MQQIALIIDDWSREGFDGVSLSCGLVKLVRHADRAESQYFDTLADAEAAIENYAADFSHDHTASYRRGQREAVYGVKLGFTWGTVKPNWEAYEAGFNDGRFWQ
jgi:hypothetical protein